MSTMMMRNTRSRQTASAADALVAVLSVTCSGIIVRKRLGTFSISSIHRMSTNCLPAPGPALGSDADGAWTIDAISLTSASSPGAGPAIFSALAILALSSSGLNGFKM